MSTDILNYLAWAGCAICNFWLLGFLRPQGDRYIRLFVSVLVGALVPVNFVIATVAAFVFAMNVHDMERR